VVTTMSVLLEKAREFATAKHRGQKGKRPGELCIQHIENSPSSAAPARLSDRLTAVVRPLHPGPILCPRR
jgi:hypothetical protein